MNSDMNWYNIDMNSKLRIKAKNNFEKDFFKADE